MIAKCFFGKMRFGVHNESDFIIVFRRGGAQMSATAFSANDFQSRRKTKARRFASLKIKKENQVCLKTNRCVWKRLGGSQKWLGLVMHLWNWIKIQIKENVSYYPHLFSSKSHVGSKQMRRSWQGPKLQLWQTISIPTIDQKKHQRVSLDKAQGKQI